MERREPFVAAALLTHRDLEVWGSALRNVYPINEDSNFDDLLRDIDRSIRSGRVGQGGG